MRRRPTANRYERRAVTFAVALCGGFVAILLLSVALGGAPKSCYTAHGYPHPDSIYHTRGACEYFPHEPAPNGYQWYEILGGYAVLLGVVAIPVAFYYNALRYALKR